MITRQTLLHGFVLGERIVEPRLGVIVTDGVARRLAPRAMSVLLLLAERQGELVGREEIVSRVYPGEPITHQTLARHISEIRRTLDDDSRDPRFIETVPKGGYRLISTIVAEDAFGDDAMVGACVLSHHGRLEKAIPASGFFRELRQRKVVRAALLYVLIVWFSLQVGEIVFPALGLPDWTLTFVVLLGALGFPIALVLAWVFDLTPNGLTLDVGTHSAKGAAYGNIKRLDLLVVVTLLGVVLFLAGQLIMQARANDSASATFAQNCQNAAMASADLRLNGQ